jgi:hypothetical protein
LRVIDRLFLFLRHHNLTPYNFERGCGIANGYLKKQTKGKGTIGSEILEKILARHKDLSLSWLITGKGTMLVDSGEAPENILNEEQTPYRTSQEVIRLLREKITVLENSLADKEKIIRMLEGRMKK